MKPLIGSALAAVFLMTMAPLLHADGELSSAELQGVPLESGRTIPRLRIAYRTYGALNADKTNAVLFPTWLMGTSKELADLGYIGPGKAADSSRWFVIAVDNPGNGVSTSPSNRARHGVTELPPMTVRDLVNVQRALVTGHLKLERLHAVMGISMGALQALEWSVSHPDMMTRVVAIAGTPRITTHELLLWNSQVALIEAARGMKDGNRTAMRLIAPTHALMSRTPEFFITQVPPENYPALLNATETALAAYRAEDWAWQVRAIVTHDIARPYGGSLARAAARVRARTLVIVSPGDRMVLPQGALEYARLVRAKTIENTGACGHFSFLCERDAIAPRIRTFIE
ncbi:MAG TPA: alpha/beta fold hydrolase [Spirochaetota bacterium]|nr:alpha/beta fold hydrolase [Spirochaetota bacterium]HPI22201.1 alpha/beta fold hydrolase [Spirochaetota bacterium]